MIRIDPDHLPGLSAPKSSPLLPPDLVTKSAKAAGPSIEELYERFVASDASRVARMRRDEGGFR